MKPFNLEEYLKNPSKKVVTRDRRTVRIICTDAKGDYPIVALVEKYNGTIDDAIRYTKDGRYFKGETNEKDLFFATEKHEGWVNMFAGVIGNCVNSCIFKSKEDAEKEGKNWNSYVASIKIEWEE